MKISSHEVWILPHQRPWSAEKNIARGHRCGQDGEGTDTARVAKRLLSWERFSAFYSFSVSFLIGLFSTKNVVWTIEERAERYSRRGSINGYAMGERGKAVASYRISWSRPERTASLCVSGKRIGACVLCGFQSLVSLNFDHAKSAMLRHLLADWQDWRME